MFVLNCITESDVAKDILCVYALLLNKSIKQT